MPNTVPERLPAFSLLLARAYQDDAFLNHGTLKESFPQ
jgi:hypothetical protein